jgi:hypothetical protein
MLQTATSLETLDFYLDNLGSHLALETTAWAQAIAEHALLATLCIHVSNATSTMACILLSQLRVTSGALSHINLRYNEWTAADPDDVVADNMSVQMHALGFILQSTSTLKHLTLGSYKFNKASMGQLVAGLSANSTVTKLSLVGKCHFDSAATKAFVNYMQGKTEKEQATLSELHLSDLTLFKDVAIVKLLASILALKPALGNDATHCTIGSSVQSFATSGSSFPSVMNVMAQHAGTIRLSTVRFEYVSLISQLDSFCSNLPALLYLKELTIRNVERGRTDEDQVLDALRSNGSLLRVSSSGVLYTEASKKRLKNYLKRNESVPAMLANGEKNFDALLGRSLFPTLFQVAKSMPAMSANMILVGLLTASSNDSFGPLTGGKRTRTSIRSCS